MAGSKADRRTLGELVEAWWLYHGQTLKNGVIERRHLNKTVAALGNPAVNRLTKRVLMQHRSGRLAAGISAPTINRDMYRLSGMFTTLKKIEEFDGVNPAQGLPALSEKQPAMTFMTEQEIIRLLDVLTGHSRCVALLCLSTGARWSEASTLRAEQVVNGRVTFLETKNGKKRIVPISDVLQKEILTQDSGQLFKVDYERFCGTLRAVKPDLPRGQATHVLRHTFASHFMMKGGNIIALQQILGHATINQTMAYAHLAPDYLQLAITLNPLGGKLAP